MPLRADLKRLRGERPWLRRLGLLTAVALAVAPPLALVGVLTGRLSAWGVDFKAYYLAGLRVRHGVALYDSGAFVATVPEPAATKFLYPPVVALAFVPLTFLPPDPARAVWVTLQLAALFAGVLTLLRAFGHRLSPARSALVCWLVLGFQPVGFLARIGNVSGFLAAGLCFAAAVTVAPGGPDRPALGGALAALAAFPKPYVAPAGAHLLRDRWRLVGACLAGAIALGIGLLAFGPETHRRYLDVLLAGEGRNVRGVSEGLPRHFQPFFRFPGARFSLQMGLLVLTAVVAVGAAIAARTGDEFAANRRRDAAVFALGVVAVPLVAPATTLTLVVAVPGLLVALLGEWHADGTPELVVVAVLLVQVNVHGLRLLRGYGPRNAPGLPWKALADLVVVQPATVGLLLVFGLLVVRALRP
jgi:alpha-1,2-mannosyltransferase